MTNLVMKYNINVDGREIIEIHEYEYLGHEVHEYEYLDHEVRIDNQMYEINRQI